VCDTCVCSYKSEYASRYLEPWKLFHRHSIAAAHGHRARRDDDDDDGDDEGTAGNDDQSHPHHNSQVLQFTRFLVSNEQSVVNFRDGHSALVTCYIAGVDVNEP